ncbi:hypothetical protein HanRHA438_Chr06g0257261 [Helianthus annuus]|nr:hypothetical protein HanRHA438_Chr06g0257261 [Helianthus annuus]
MASYEATWSCVCTSGRIHYVVRSYKGTPFVRMGLYITKPSIRNDFHSIQYNIPHTLYLAYSHSGRHTKYAPTKRIKLRGLHCTGR